MPSIFDPPVREDLEHCSGCGARFPRVEGPVHPYMESSPGCWAAYGELLAREYGDPSVADVHRLSVDAYAVQHPGTPSPQSLQSVNLHLVRLLLQLRRGLPPERANDAMLALARHKRSFTWLEPPVSRGEVTIADVLPRAQSGHHREAVRDWANSALAAWSAHQPIVDRWAALVSPGS